MAAQAVARQINRHHVTAGRRKPRREKVKAGSVVRPAMNREDVARLPRTSARAGRPVFRSEHCPTAEIQFDLVGEYAKGSAQHACVHAGRQNACPA